MRADHSDAHGVYPDLVFRQIVTHGLGHGLPAAADALGMDEAGGVLAQDVVTLIIAPRRILSYEGQRTRESYRAKQLEIQIRCPLFVVDQLKWPGAAAPALFTRISSCP